MSYQPLWINGREVGVGLRDCNTRYRAIADSLHASPGAIGSALDFGAYGCYFSARLAEDFNASVTAVDGDPVLADSYHKPQRGSVSLVVKRLEPKEIQDLGWFDVALCLSVLHHHQDWKRYLMALLDAAPILFVETPHPAEVLPNALGHNHSEAIIATMLNDLQAQPLVQTPGWDATHQRTLWRVG